MGRARDDAERAFARRTGRRPDLFAELLRYCLVCGLLFVFLPPVGWAVAFFWGIGLARRALAARRLPDSPPRFPRPAPTAGPRLEELRIEDLVDSALAARADRIAQGEVALSREMEAPGALRGDAASLDRALGLLLDCALDDLEAGKGQGSPNEEEELVPRSEPQASVAGKSRRLTVEVGENLAGTEVWVRVRALRDAPEPAERPAADRLAVPKQIAEAHGGRLEACSSPDLELLLTLPKRST